MTARNQRVLPADVYDALEFSALAFRGVGGELLFADMAWRDVPLCIYGHAGFASNDADCFHNPIAHALDRAIGHLHVYGGPSVNNLAVARINKRKGYSRANRVTWEEYTRELKIVRGDS